VGAPQGTYESFLYDRIRDTVYTLKADSILGIQDLPDYVKDYPKQLEERKKKPVNRPIFISVLNWSPSSAYAVADISSFDNKYRWLMLVDTAGKMKMIDRQRDEAWIGGPGTGGFGGGTGWMDDQTFYFRSDATGYSN